jgi:histidinol dehydrogenase
MGMGSELLPLIRVDDRASIEGVVRRVRGRPQDLAQVAQKARQIVETVREGGDEALIRYSREFDGVELRSGELKVPAEETEAAWSRASPELKNAMSFALKRIQRTQGQLLRRVPFSYVSEGFVVRCVVRPLDSVGCYIPGGKASYASTVLMTAGVAKAAGVRRVVVCSPADKEGRVSDPVLAAAKLCGADEVYRIGGAQAIAALAYGTASVPRVSKIVGPGGLFVSAAKKLVSADVPIGFFAGPTEMVVLADGKADARLAAWDLIAQAEHGTDGVCCLVTWDAKLAKSVKKIAEEVSPGLQRREFVQGTLRRGFAVVCKDRDTALELVNALAPEHLELMVDGARRVAESIENAGLILAGPYAPGAASDYAVGTDHVLPTEGVAKQRAGLTALDFVKVNWVVEGTRRGLRSLLPMLKELTTAEGLPNHFLSAQARFEKNGDE